MSIVLWYYLKVTKMTGGGMAQTEQQRLQHAERRLSGFCVQCGRLADHSYRCEECFQAHRDNRIRRETARKLAGQCLCCALPAVDRQYCAEHGQRKRLWERLYDLPIAEREKAKTALALFDGHCQCCGADSPGSRQGWHIDHDHVTGKFRGIICSRCNTMLGMAKDDIQRLAAGIAYLTSFCNEYARIRPVTSQADEGSTPSDSTNALVDNANVLVGSPGLDA
jgi:recombination endonuclease VII